MYEMLSMLQVLQIHYFIKSLQNSAEYILLFLLTIDKWRLGEVQHAVQRQKWQDFTSDWLYACALSTPLMCKPNSAYYYPV